jgi:hypothetical protein
VLIASHGFAAGVVIETFTAASELLARCEPSPEQRFASLSGLWAFHNARANYPEAIEISERLLDLAGQRDAVALHSVAHSYACQTSLLVGKFAATTRLASTIEEWSDFDAQKERVLRHGLDPWLTALTFGCLAKVLMGRISEVECEVKFGFEMTERLQSRVHDSTYLGQAALVQLFLGGVGPRPNPAIEQCKAYAARGLELAEKYGLQFASGYAKILLAMADAPSGDPEAIAGLEQALQIWRQLGLQASISWHLSILAQGKCAGGDFAGALVCAREAVDHCERTGEGYGESEAFRTLALVLGDPRNPDRDPEAAFSAFQHAIDDARRREARWLLLRATYSFHLQVRSADSRAELCTALSWFTEQREALDQPLVTDALSLIA